KQAATTVLPSPQVAVAIEKNGTTAAVAWPDNSQNESAFDVYVSSHGGGTWNLAGSTGSSQQFTDISGLTSSTQYRFKVQARNSVTVAMDTVNVPIQPAAPSNVTAV